MSLGSAYKININITIKQQCFFLYYMIFIIITRKIIIKSTNLYIKHSKISF
jgi:hypothetical protein